MREEEEEEEELMSWRSLVSLPFSPPLPCAPLPLPLLLRSSVGHSFCSSHALLLQTFKGDRNAATGRALIAVVLNCEFLVKSSSRMPKL